MDEQYRPRHFVLQELIPRSIFEERGEEAWGLLDAGMLRALDRLRVAVGPLVVNNWHVGGAYHESGLRTQTTSTGAKRSAHKLGKAFDIKPTACSVKALHDHILANEEAYPEIRRLENISATPTWVHIDSIEHAFSGIKVFLP